MQRHAAGGAFAVEAGALGLVSGSGKPLPDSVRGKLEAALGADFSGVRVHVGPQAERIGAIAFTTGNDIYFAPGRYQPETIQGQQLLGHELAHVVQQRARCVRNPLGSGLAVVQDRALEAEADRLGRLAGAMAQRAVAQPKTADFRVGPQQARDGRHHSTSTTKGVGAIQRKIWKYNETKPGWDLVETGSEGAYLKPDVPADKEKPFFNDISGKAGENIKAVRTGLADLMLMTGSLGELKPPGELKREFSWPPTLWQDLNKVARNKILSEENVKKHIDNTKKDAENRKTNDPSIDVEDEVRKEKKWILNISGSVVYLGKVTLRHKSDKVGRRFTSYTLDDKDKEHVKTSLLKRTWTEFLEPFMEANGQLPYIRRRNWYGSAASVVVDVNFYYNRGADRTFEFHKDTGADNLFVNLIFNNKEPILATEWIEDLAAERRKGKKIAALKKNLPDAQIDRITNTRAKFNRKKDPYKLAGEGFVRGGFATGNAAYVSWVDELIWHSTPAPISRTEYYKNILKPENYWRYKPYAIVALRDMWKENVRMYFKGEDYNFKTFVDFCWKKGVTWDTNWDTSDTEDLNSNINVAASRITTTLCDEYMNTVQKQNEKTKGENFTAHEKAIGSLAKYTVKDMSRGQDIDADPVALTTKSHNKDTGITPVVRRRNSFSENQIAAIGQKPRSFIRTWVRIHKDGR